MLGIAHKVRYNISPFFSRDNDQMRVKTAPRLRLQPARYPCQATLFSTKQSVIEQIIESSDSCLVNTNKKDKSNNSIHFNKNSFKSTNTQVHRFNFANSQTGAASWILALFAATIMFTVIVGLIFGHNLGYQRGYHALEAENKKAVDSGQMTVQELEELRTSHKVLSNQVAIAKQELTISLNNLDELRENQQELSVENRQTNQLNELYAKALSKSGGLPLQILAAKIEPLPENAFEYGFDVAMLSKDSQSKRLNVRLTLLNNDDFVDVPLDTDRYLIEGIARIRGRFVMPNDFKPLQVKLVLEASGQKVEQLYDWKLGERVDNMPISLIDLPEVDESPIEP